MSCCSSPSSAWTLLLPLYSHSLTPSLPPTLPLAILHRSTWGGDTPPIEGDTVFIQAGRSVLLDVSPPRLMLLIVQGNLIFDREQPNLWLQANYILVNGGNLTVGTPE